jgi:hypothetical protein
MRRWFPTFRNDHAGPLNARVHRKMGGLYPADESAAELSVVAIDVHQYRPEPPPELVGRAAQIWRDIVSTLPAGWLTRANEPLLLAYCRHIATAEHLASLLDKVEGPFQPEGLKQFDKLPRMRDRESKVALALARAMRLTQQTQMHPRTAGRAVTNSGGQKLWERKPWEDSEPRPS